MVKRLTPLKAIREHCFECSGWSFLERKNCEHTECSLYPYRFGKRPKEKPKYTPVRAMRQFCIECAGTVYKDRELCPANECYLYPYRLGKNPGQKRTHNPILENKRADS